MPNEVTLNSEQRVKITVNPVTPKGKPSKIQPGSLLLEPDSSSVTIEPIDDNNAWIVGTENDGDTIVTVSGDADLGEGVVTIRDTVLVHVADAPATQLGVSVGTPETQP